MVELLFPVTLRQDMKDVFRHPIGLGLRGVVQRIKKCKHSCVVDVFIIHRFSLPVKPRLSSGLVSDDDYILSVVGNKF
jgi:hypothetical protein